MKTLTQRILNIVLLQISILILSFASIIAKKASMLYFLTFDFACYYFLELIIIGIYAILWQQAIKKVDLSIAYANKGTLIIWTFVWAVIFFHETISLNNILGAVLVIAGIVMVFKDA